MKVVVTGSHGFIGSYVCQELLDHGYEVLGIDNFSKYGIVHRAFESHPNFTLFRADARHINNLDESHIFEGTNYIIAGAAMIGGIGYFHKYAYDLLATNERIMASTMDLAIALNQGYDRLNVDLKRVVVLSSSMVYESTGHYPTPEYATHECPPPMSTYGFQKLATEYFCKGASEQYDLPFTIIRPFNCVGVGEDRAIHADEVTHGNIKLMMSHVLPDLVAKALALGPNDSLPILGSGEQIRCYTNGKDIARGIRLAMESPNGHNDIFNISAERSTSVRELAEIVWRKIHGTPLRLTHLPSYIHDVQKRIPDVTKAKRQLNFEATIPLEESVDEVIEWMRQSKHSLAT